MIVSFRFGGIPVRVHLWPLALGVLLGIWAHDGPLGAVGRVLGFAIVLFLHELAHAAVARRFGAPAEIDVVVFRGALRDRIASLSAARRIVVHLAGPAVNLLCGAMALGILCVRPAGIGVGPGALRFVAWINVGWGLLNLVPILPLDAGCALAAALDRGTAIRGEDAARHVSMWLGVLLGCMALVLRILPAALICGFLAFQNAHAVQIARYVRNRDAILRVHLGAAFKALEQGHTSAAIDHCRQVLDSAIDPGARRDAVRLLAYAYATSGVWAKLVELLESGGAEVLDGAELEKYQQAARELGRTDYARRIAVLRERTV